MGTLTGLTRTASPQVSVGVCNAFAPLRVLRFAKEEDAQALQTQLAFLQGEDQPKIESQHLRQNLSILGGTGVAFESLN